MAPAKVSNPTPITGEMPCNRLAIKPRLMSAKPRLMSALGTSDVYHYPGGKQLGTSGTVHEGKTLLYRASKLDCDVCPLKSQCCPKEPSRKIPRDIHEHARDVARSLADTEAFEESRRDRKKIEMRFAHLKRILKLGRLRLRGPRGAQDESVPAAIAQNLRRLASLVARPPPTQALCIA